MVFDIEQQETDEPPLEKSNSIRQDQVTVCLRVRWLSGAQGPSRQLVLRPVGWNTAAQLPVAFVSQR